MFWPKAIIQNLAMAIPIISRTSARFHNTGGGALDSPNYLKRVLENSDQIYNTLLQFLPDFEPLSILDFGFGRRPDVLHHLSRKYPRARLYAVEKELKHRTDLSNNITITDNLLGVKNIDFIYAIDVFEHLKKPDVILKRLSHISSVNGYIYLDIDLCSHYVSRSSLDAFSHYKYSDFFWMAMTSNRSSYTNRITAHQWKEEVSRYIDILYFNAVPHPRSKEIALKYAIPGEHLYERVKILGSFKREL